MNGAACAYVVPDRVRPEQFHEGDGRGSRRPGGGSRPTWGGEIQAVQAVQEVLRLDQMPLSGGEGLEGSARLPAERGPDTLRSDSMP